MDKLIIWTITFVVGFFSSIYMGFVASFLWLWYVTPTFGLAVPSIWILIGLAIFARLFTHQIPPMREDEPNQITLLIYSVVYSLFYTSSVFISGWIFHHFA